MSQASNAYPPVAPPRMVRQVPPPATVGERLVAVAIFLASTGVLLTAYTLRPDPAGMGTHTQLGLPACGFKAATRLPCATCGMTTAFSHAVHGRWVASFVTQPAGALLALATAAASIISAYAVVSGMSLRPLARWLWRPSVVWTAGGLLIAGWMYKIVLTLWT